MKIGILGTGEVGRSLTTGFLETGHQVAIGTRDVSRPELLEWSKANGEKAQLASFAQAAENAELIVIAVPWTAVENAIALAGKVRFTGKIVVDVTNPLDFSQGTPNFAIAYPDSAGAQIQKWLPEAMVVKAFNIITNGQMYKPHFAEGTPDMFIAGDDPAAKAQVSEILKAFGWGRVNDMGDIAQAYLLEALAMAWIRWGVINNTWSHGLSLLRA